MTKTISLCILFAALSLAQTVPLETRPQRGFLPSAAYSISELDSVSAVNGNLSLRVPLASLPPGRAGHGFDVELIYNSQIYDISIGRRMSPYRHEVLTQELTKGTTGGWHYNFANIGVDYEIRQSPTGGWTCETDGVEAMRLNRLRIGLADGSQHVLHLRGYGDELGDGYRGDGYYAIGPDGRYVGCGTLPNVTGRLTYYTSDGTFLKLEIDADGSSWAEKQWTLYFPDGRRITGYTDRADAIYDANGNRIDIQQLCRDPECNTTYTQVSDSFGRAVTIDYDTSDPNKSHQDTIRAAAFSGNATWTVQWDSVMIGGSSVLGGDDRTYECGPEDTYCSLSIGHRVVSRIDVPSTPSSFYQFDYSTNADFGYGELDYMKTPYGAEVTYRYLQENQFKILTTLLKNPVKSKTVTHDGQTDPAWQYQFNFTQSTITNPDGGVVTTYFYDPDMLSDWRRGLVHKIVQPEGDVVERIWEQNKTWGLRGSSITDPNNPFVKKELSSVANGGVPVKTAITEFDRDKNGNLLERREYDWVANGTTTGSVVRRRTTQTFYVPAPSSSTITDSANAYWRPHNASLWLDPLSGRRLDAVFRRETAGKTGEETGEAVQAASEFEYDDAYKNGNLTKSKQWDSTKAEALPGPGRFSAANAVILTRAYDSFGNLTDIFDPEVRTSYTYGSLCGMQNLYPEQIQQAPGLPEQRTTTYSWNCGTGLMASQTDVENSFAITYLYDQLGRRTEAKEGNLRVKSTTYDDSSRKVTAKADLGGFGDGKLQTVAHYDQLGRVRLVRESDGAPLSGSGETDGIKVQTIRRIATGGNIEIVSNPYRAGGESTMGWTCRQQDRNGRVRWVGSFAGAAAPNSCLDAANRTGLSETRYEGEMTVSIDPAGKRRDLARDALARLTGATEYTGGTPATYLTSYQYNALDNLKTVLQGSQARQFDYSSLGRLVSAHNPESGSVSYTYYDHGGLHTRTDARSVVTTHSYDGLLRLRTKTFTGGTPAVTHEYYLAGNAPQVGRLKSVATSGGSTVYSYDALGRVTGSTQTTAAKPFPFIYHYNLADMVTDVTYPSQRVVNYARDGAGRVTSVTGASPDDKYAKDIQYTAHGAIGQVTMGALTEATGFNDRLQTTTVSVGAPWTVNLYYCPNEAATCATNNGNVQRQKITAAGAVFVQDYTYDGLNRLKGALEANRPGQTGWKEDGDFDALGNRWITLREGLPPLSADVPQSAESFARDVNGIPTNRVANVGYDYNGNATQIGVQALQYDGENRLKQADWNGTTTTYEYDGEGRRVLKTVVGTVKTVKTVYVYDAMGQLAAEYTDGSTESGRRYLTTDHLGSTRLVTDKDGNPVERMDYLPFGDRVPGASNGRAAIPGYAAETSLAQRFTGKERDAETGLDYFGARYYSGAQGRFTTPDPIHILKQKIGDPQQWNMYSYARNNPLRFFDPTGMYVASCNNDVKGCPKEIEQFERTREQALKSRDEKIRAAASAYGALGEKNGVNLTIAKVVDAKHRSVVGQVTEQAGTGGFTFESGKFQQATQVTIKAGLDGRDRLAAAVHEGVHVQDRARFVGTMQLADPQFNPRLNILSITSERNAYGVENILLRSLGLPERNIEDILSRQPYSDSPTIRLPLFPGLPTEDIP